MVERARDRAVLGDEVRADGDPLERPLDLVEQRAIARDVWKRDRDLVVLRAVFVLATSSAAPRRASAVLAGSGASASAGWLAFGPRPDAWPAASLPAVHPATVRR